MPWYRINGSMVHMRGTKLPPSCHAPFELDGKRVRCMAIAPYLCDWPLGDGRTCDAPICEEHRTNVGADKDYCPEHAAEAQRQTGPVTGLLP